MKEAESLSVILPTYNSNVSALEAVLVSLENQSYKDFVCYLVDDSDDEHSEAIKTISKPFPFLRYRQGFKKGIASALNLGISLSRGEYIARVDDSDIITLIVLKNKLLFYWKIQMSMFLGQTFPIIIKAENSFHHYLHRTLRSKRSTARTWDSKWPANWVVW